MMGLSSSAKAATSRLGWGHNGRLLSMEPVPQTYAEFTWFYRRLFSMMQTHMFTGGVHERET